ncbi:hypothetical protein HBI70_239350 [Parastagonospora nodorum]|nr:hypothetical protein HBH53_054440 [Parastagonospora nodorum]KAH3994891.1 hypothetical protein HBI10_180600 [Parastagonospora nodorum]KAH4015021.1 hypothetical protein HBI13_165730 [Parastagonospora nodorum]KAH5010984.1 hypothetical protein HBI74_199220 [Parastagonospora nodorum]KAH5243736.1 hypothetical protein HBI70_239350 [Parastagonospora nodorum]
MQTKFMAGDEAHESGAPGSVLLSTQPHLAPMFPRIHRESQSNLGTRRGVRSGEHHASRITANLRPHATHTAHTAGPRSRNMCGHGGERGVFSTPTMSHSPFFV